MYRFRALVRNMGSADHSLDITLEIVKSAPLVLDLLSQNLPFIRMEEGSSWSYHMA